MDALSHVTWSLWLNRLFSYCIEEQTGDNKVTIWQIWMIFTHNTEKGLFGLKAILVIKSYIAGNASKCEVIYIRPVMIAILLVRDKVAWASMYDMCAHHTHYKHGVLRIYVLHGPLRMFSLFLLALNRLHLNLVVLKNIQTWSTRPLVEDVFKLNA